MRPEMGPGTLKSENVSSKINIPDPGTSNSAQPETKYTPWKIIKNNKHNSFGKYPFSSQYSKKCTKNKKLDTLQRLYTGIYKTKMRIKPK